MRMLNYPGLNSWNTTLVQSTTKAVVKLDLPALDFTVKLLADIQKSFKNISESYRYTQVPFKYDLDL